MIVIDPTTTRYRFWDDEVAVAPFEVANGDPEEEIDGIKQLPATFPGVTGYLPDVRELYRSVCASRSISTLFAWDHERP